MTSEPKNKWCCISDQERQDFFDRADAMIANMTSEAIAQGDRERDELEQLFGLPLELLEGAEDDRHQV